MALALPLGKTPAVRKLFSSLKVDDSSFRKDWDWQPAVELEEGLRHMASSWRNYGGWVV